MAEPERSRQCLRKLTEDEISLMGRVTTQGEEWIGMLPVKGRAFELARERMREAMMWAVRGITS
jgi:hypothetical protein